MIYYISSYPRTVNLWNFLATWGKPIANRFVPVTYQKLLWPWHKDEHSDPSPASIAIQDQLIQPGDINSKGIFIFSEPTRLPPREQEAIAHICDELALLGSDVIQLNHPLRSMGRYELLRTLKERGINDFDIYRLNEARIPTKFPVFLRTEQDHKGATTLLIDTEVALSKAIEKLDRNGQARMDKVITEFYNVPDERGLYRKYSAWKVGSEVFPGHMFASKDWMVKTPEVVDQQLLDEEMEYLQANPHKDQLETIFNIGKVGYGRMDYAVMNGQVQCYEINLDPGIPSSPSPGEEGQRRVSADHWFVAKYIEAIEVLDT